MVLWVADSPVRPGGKKRLGQARQSDTRRRVRGPRLTESGKAGRFARWRSLPRDATGHPLGRMGQYWGRREDWEPSWVAITTLPSGILSSTENNSRGRVSIWSIDLDGIGDPHWSPWTKHAG
ncbi:hypothetical protein BJX96DRAFT_160188, partial [Aspergillus floccosus]